MRCLSTMAILCTSSAILVPSSLAQSNAPSPASADGKRQQLLSLFDEEWEYGLRTNPEWATVLGDNRYNDRLGDNSPDFFRADVEQKRKFLARFEAVDPTGLPQQDALSRELMIRQLRRRSKAPSSNTTKCWETERSRWMFWSRR